MGFHVPEKYRVKFGALKSTEAYGNNGVFIIESRRLKKPIRCIASDGLDWEHVSVSLNTRCPTWDEMCFIKNLFWDVEDCVMQLHPPQSEWVNNHPFTLHLWKPLGLEIPRPLQSMI